jgi:hypothetical protein
MKPPPNDKDPLANWAASALRQLQDRPAPAGFGIQVLAEIRRRANLPWYQRPWTHWPAPQQWFSALVFAALIIGVFKVGIPLLQDTAAETAYGQRATLAFNSVSALKSVGINLVRAARLSLEQVSTTHITLALGSIIAAWLSTVGLGAVCWRATAQPR